MSAHLLIEPVATLLLVLGLAWPLGEWLGQVLFDRAAPGPLERRLLGWAGAGPDEMDWRQYARAVLLFNLLGTVAVYAVQRLQQVLPLNPAQLPAVEPGVAMNTAISFATNTNWQAYAGETTLSPFTQMVALTTQNFVSAATGLAVLLALLRGLTRTGAGTVGSFWVDLLRATGVLLLLTIPVGVALNQLGVPQTLEVLRDGVATGPVASQEAIKQLGTNGGGFFNVNAAHPLENPSPLTNLIEVVCILLLPAALPFTFGRAVGDRRQGFALLAAMLVLFVPALALTVRAEQAGVPALAALGVDASAGHLEGKEVRFGATSSAVWAVATTAASNGSVNAMHDSFTPLGGLAPLVLMQLGEVVFGGVGSGLYGLLLYVVVAVFIAGLMVGRTPEYLGKRIEVREMKMAALGLLVPAAAVLVGTALATRFAPETVANPGPHGFSELLYAFSSAANNNGSAFAGLTANGAFLTAGLGVCMWAGRFFVIIPVLAIAGGLAGKQRVAVSAGTLPTHGPLFVTLLAGTIVLFGALTFIPSVALGPIVEHLQVTGGTP